MIYDHDMGKPKYVLLQEFSAKLVSADPMALSITDQLEYEAEALSILSRFNEAALHIVPEDESDSVQIATILVKQAFEFWFNEAITVNFEPLAKDLLKMYRAEAVAVPQKKKEVKSVSIG